MEGTHTHQLDSILILIFGRLDKSFLVRARDDSVKIISGLTPYFLLNEPAV